MRVVVKLGGTLLDAPATRTALARQIAAVAQQHELVVVHGGGKQMTTFLEERGVQSQFVNGLRVTTPEVVDALLKVFAGSVNHQLVAALVAAGARAVGLSGIDAGLVTAEQLDPALGAVGKPVRSDPAVLTVLTGNGFTPVVACVAGDGQGGVFNVNADQMAVACAAAYGAERLLFLTDVSGVRGADGQTIAQLDPAAVAELIATGVAQGGMQAKLNAAVAAVRGGVGAVQIAPGAADEILPRLLTGESVGTQVGPGGEVTG